MHHTVAETPEYKKHAEKLFDETERADIINFLAEHPQAGDLIPGTGGVRKLRWAAKGKGKRGGARIIYFYYNERYPLFLLSLFSKDKKADLSQAERNELASLTKTLIQTYQRNSL